MKMTVDLSTLLDPDLDEVDYNDELEATQNRYSFIMNGIKAQQESGIEPYTLPLTISEWLNFANDKYITASKNDAINLVCIDKEWLIVADGYRVHAHKNQYGLATGLYYLLNDHLIPHPDKTKRYVDIWSVIDKANQEIETASVKIDYTARTSHDYGVFDAFRFDTPSFSVFVQREYMEQALFLGVGYEILVSSAKRPIKIVWPDAYAIIMPCEPPLSYRFAK